MWSVENRTPYAADRSWIRDGDGAEVWIVAVKATYDIRSDGSTVASAEQPPVCSGPQPHAGLQSLRYETDLGPAKTATDIVLNGSAHVQGDAPAAELLVALRVGSLTRKLRVVGDRHWKSGLLGWGASKPAPFHSMPLVCERAFGGDALDAPRSSGNPLGRGLAPEADGRVWLPNIEAIDAPVTGRGSRPKPILLGPVPSHWPGRRQYAGTYDEEWFKHRRPLQAADLDPRHWQIAVPEQQVPGWLRGGEPVTLINLTPPGIADKGRLAFRLPKLSLAFETRFYDGSMARSRSAIHTVIIEPDFPRVSVVHHISLPCHPKVNLLDRTIVREKQRPLDGAGAASDDDWDDLGAAQASAAPRELNASTAGRP